MIYIGVLLCIAFVLMCFLAIEIYIIDDADFNTTYQDCIIDNIPSLKYANKLQ